MLNSFGGLKVIEDINCIQTWQLTDFTKELMGEDWVKQFNVWAEYALPKQPGCLQAGDTLIVHPLIAHEFRKLVAMEYNKLPLPVNLKQYGEVYTTND